MNVLWIDKSMFIDWHCWGWNMLELSESEGIRELFYYELFICYGFINASPLLTCIDSGYLFLIVYRLKNYSFVNEINLFYLN
jgi:hypothetical protein